MILRPNKLLMSILGGVTCLITTCEVKGSEIDFNRDIRPILSDKCFFCHGPDSHERKADLRLDTGEGALADLGGYAAIVPGKLDDSEMIQRILDREDPMPPKESHKELSQEEIALLSRWIQEGAEYSEPWAYVPPVKRELPGVKDTSWPSNWIDQFVLERLEEEGMSPSPDADRLTLVRRLYFDLIGLPPQPEEAEAFIRGDQSLDELVDALLNSPHFGERMAMYWLDLVRFADTVGYHGDQEHNISPYRDYVIRSFNQNLPFDRFTREQLAGDLLDNPGKWQKVASGYNRLLQTSHEGGIQKKEYDAIYAADRVRNLSAVWMGATVGCAQCHDHKYDPYTLKDHYALAAFFADVHDDGYNGNSNPTNRPPEMMFYSAEQEDEIARLNGEMIALLGKKLAGRVEELEKKRASLQADLKVGKGKKDREKAALEQVESEILNLVPEEKRVRWGTLLAGKWKVEKAGRSTMITRAAPPREMRVLSRGNWLDDSGEIVEPAIPAFLGKIAVPEGKRPDRLDLANWLTDSETGVGGLTARVFVNRFWYLFFGSGISRSLEDFGGQGEPPSNPELLDQLAVTFVESGWDVREMVRLLVTSRAYRQSSLTSPELSERDPYNQLVARQSRYRLPAEMVRDTALSISGLLVPDLGGASVRPYQPAGYYRHLNFPKRTYRMDENAQQWRRGVYVRWQRMFLHPMMKAFDAPSREECTARRPRSNTPNAALVLLNDPTFIEAARVFAERILREGGETPDRRIDFACRVALSRVATSREREVLSTLLAETKALYEDEPNAIQDLLGNGLAPVDAGLESLELASWTAVARALLNLNETVTRN